MSVAAAAADDDAAAACRCRRRLRRRRRRRRRCWLAAAGLAEYDVLDTKLVDFDDLDGELYMAAPPPSRTRERVRLSSTRVAADLDREPAAPSCSSQPGARLEPFVRRSDLTPNLHRSTRHFP